MSMIISKIAQEKKVFLWEMRKRCLIFHKAVL